LRRLRRLTEGGTGNGEPGTEKPNGGIRDSDNDGRQSAVWLAAHFNGRVFERRGPRPPAKATAEGRKATAALDNSPEKRIALQPSDAAFGVAQPVESSWFNTSAPTGRRDRRTGARAGRNEVKVMFIGSSPAPQNPVKVIFIASSPEPRGAAARSRAVAAS